MKSLSMKMKKKSLQFRGVLNLDLEKLCEPFIHEESGYQQFLLFYIQYVLYKYCMYCTSSTCTGTVNNTELLLYFLLSTDRHEPPILSLLLLFLMLLNFLFHLFNVKRVLSCTARTCRNILWRYGEIIIVLEVIETFISIMSTKIIILFETSEIFVLFVQNPPFQICTTYW